MTKEQVNIAIINGLKAKGHEVLKLNPDLLADFANITYKLLNIHDVVFNEAKTIDKQTQKKLIEQIMKADEELGLYSEVELVCNRINNFDNNRCINCGAKAGQKCEIQTN